MEKCEAAKILLVVFIVFQNYGKLAGAAKEADQSTKSVNSDVDVVAQPCQPHDSCRNRCIKDSSAIDARQENATIRQLNCFCDNDCKTFGDCCWDYQNECTVRKVPSSKLDDSNAAENTWSLSPRDDSFECVVVDQISKGSFWMVTRCADDWKNKEMAKKCEEVGDLTFDKNLPVLGDTGWTYRNAFCAQCNHVTNYLFWSLKANCIRSAPEEVLSGDPEMLTYYVEHFCVVKLEQGSTFGEETKNGFDKDRIESIAWKKSLRSCVQGMIDGCPDGYEDEAVARKCQSYQSVLIKPGSGLSHGSNVVYKNPFCAFCNGADLSDLDDTASSKLDKTKDLRVDEDKNTVRDLVCPVWFLSTYYDSEYWKLDAHVSSKSLRPVFNTNYKSSSWTPPSFSILMRFEDDDDIDMTYHDGSSSVVAIPVQQECRSNEIYDPFVGICRPVVCANDLIFTSSGCVPAEEDQSHDSGSNPSQNFPHAVTITISITIPKPKGNQTTSLLPDDVGKWLVEAFEDALNTSAAENVTVIRGETSAAGNCTKSSTHDNDTVKISVSFFVVEVGNYTSEDLVKMLDLVAKSINFDEMMMEMDSYSVLVLEHAYPQNILTCKENEAKIQYSSDQYRLEKYDGRSLMYINETDSYYSEDEFQLLDWVVSVSENGVESSHVEESRVVICSRNMSLGEVTPHPCNIYAPLNASEYTMLENGSLYLETRGILIRPENYINYAGGYAVCLDGYTWPAVVADDYPDYQQPIINPADVIVSWVAFGLTLFSLASLCFTFVTYCIFSELRTVSGWNIMNLTVALIVAQLLFSFGVALIDPPSLCMAIAIVLHYLFLSTFFWNNIMAYDVWATFGKGIKQPFRMSTLGHCSDAGRCKMIRKTALKYMLYGWGMPALIVGVCIAIEFCMSEEHFGYHVTEDTIFCWISNHYSNIFAFGVPLALILLVNGVFFTLSIISIHKMSKSRRRLSSVFSSTKIKVNEAQSAPPTPSTDSKIANDDVFTFNDDPTSGGRIRNKPVPTQSEARKPRSRRLSSATFKSNVSMAKISVFIYIKMSTVMGFTWCFGFLSAIFPQCAPIRYIFELLVPLQGFFIFVAFICKKRTYQLYKGLVRKNKKAEDDFGKNNSCAAKSKPPASARTVPGSNPHLTRTFHSRFQDRSRNCSSSDSSCLFTRKFSNSPGESNLAYESETAAKSRSCSESSQDNRL